MLLEGVVTFLELHGETVSQLSPETSPDFPSASGGVDDNRTFIFGSSYPLTVIVKRKD